MVMRFGSLPSSKYHCELAGEGIEYMWGYMTWIYHRIKKEKKSTKKMSEDCVKQLVDGNMVTGERIQRFSRRASHILV